MGAGCYLCELNYGTMPGKSAGDAAGACKLCGVLACLGHAIRDANRPAYLCGCCVPNLLAAAALNQLRAGDLPPDIAPPPADDEPSPDMPSGYAQWAVDISEVNDAINDLADDRWTWLRADMSYLSKLLEDADAKGPEEVRMFAHPEARRARSLMGAAAAFAVQLNLPPYELTPVLQVVAQDVRVGRR